MASSAAARYVAVRRAGALLGARPRVLSRVDGARDLPALPPVRLADKGLEDRGIVMMGALWQWVRRWWPAPPTRPLVVCAWCGLVLRTGDPQTVSHGICERCVARLRRRCRERTQ